MNMYFQLPVQTQCPEFGSSSIFLYLNCCCYLLFYLWEICLQYRNYKRWAWSLSRLVYHVRIFYQLILISWLLSLSIIFISFVHIIGSQYLTYVTHIICKCILIFQNRIFATIGVILCCDKKRHIQHTALIYMT